MLTLQRPSLVDTSKEKPSRTILETIGSCTDGEDDETIGETIRRYTVEDVGRDVPLPLLREASSEPTDADFYEASDQTAHLCRRRCILYSVTLASIVVPVVLLILGFAAAGFGVDTYVALVASNFPWYYPVLMDAALLSLLWVLDARLWRHTVLVWARRLLLLAAVVVLAAACCLSTVDYPFAPLQFSLLIVPACVYVARCLVLRRYQPQTFFVAVGNSLLIVAAGLLLYFLLWIYVFPAPPTRVATGWESGWSNTWGGPVKHYWRQRLGCSMDNSTTAELEDLTCYSAAFLWWSFPALVTLSLVLFAVLSHFVARLFDRELSSALSRDGMAVRAFAWFFILSILGVYVAASVEAAGMGLHDLVLHGVVYFVAVASAMIISSLGWKHFARALADSPWIKRVRARMEVYTELLIALAVCVGVLPFAAYIVLAVINEGFRKILPFTAPSQPGSCLTTEASRRLGKLRGVHWGSIAMKVLLCGTIYLTIGVVVSKVVVVFLCAFSYLMKGVPLYGVVLIFLVVGILMFLCPVIPGVPVYVCAGVVFPSVMMTDAERTSTSPEAPKAFWLGFALACGVGYLLKMIAISLQQEWIGRQLGRHISVRVACQVCPRLTLT